MLVKRTTLPRGVVVIIIGILCTNTLAQCPPWGYDDSLPNGPSHWGDLCPQYASCKLGQGQSPIDLRDEQVLGVPGQLKDLEYSYNEVNNITVINKHHTIEGMDLGEGNTLSFVGLHNYTLSEFHFHAPSEHTINGIQYPLEIHYLHTDAQGDRAVLSLLFESNSTAKTTWFMSYMAMILNLVPKDGNTTTIESLDIGSQVDIDKGFYHYEGSSTTPPCAGEVLWFVASSPVSIDPDTLEKFTTALKNNSRPIQSLNGRVVAHYLPNAPNGMKKVIYAIMFAALGLLLVFVILGVARYFYRIQTAKKYQNVQELVGFLGSTNNDTL